ncbi:hypothetical protein FHL15_000261 [Xylaria flabelliformis]|uniref:Uncharacterized protein n=1 Tax=Xylaria flabelliformis TaxID=2512241 RepID=A0A553IFD9_9PEZI|nr:hypothetical protein FHL15_000261 [Xylaria flabelliformis]
MSDNNVESIVKAPVANDDAKASDATDSLPPIAKEPVATAEASMVPSAPAESTATHATAALSSDTAAKPEVPSAAEAQKDSSNESSVHDASAAQSEKPSDPTSVPAPEPESTTAEAAASGIEPADPKEKAVEPPKPVSVEETRDEDLPDAKLADSEKPAEEAPKTDATGPVATTGVESTEVPAADSTSTENGDVATSKKRKAEALQDVVEPEANNIKNGDAEPLEKKPKANGAGTNGTARKPGRPRKDKKAVVPVGKTARRTRSQGIAD